LKVVKASSPAVLLKKRERKYSKIDLLHSFSIKRRILKVLIFISSFLSAVYFFFSIFLSNLQKDLLLGILERRKKRKRGKKNSAVLIRSTLESNQKKKEEAKTTE